LLLPSKPLLPAGMSLGPSLVRIDHSANLAYDSSP
jgi:hypothetical protein